MDKHLQNIEDLFKKGLEGNEEAPSDKVWNTIDQSLEKANSLKFKKKYHSLKRATAILVVMLALLSIYVLRNESNKQAQNHSKTKNVVTVEPGIKNGTNGEEENPSENLQQDPAANQVGPKTGSSNNPNTQQQLSNENINSQRINRTTENQKSEKSFVSNRAATNHVNRIREKEFKENNLVDREQSVINSEEKNKDLPIANELTVPPTIYFSPQEILTVNNKENLEGISTLSPYTSPGRIINKTAIHIQLPGRFSASIFYSPNMAFSRLRDEDRRSGNSYARQMEKKEKGSYSYSFGVAVDYQVNNKWTLESGIHFSTLKMNHEPEKIYAERDNQGTVKYQINTSSGKGYILPSFSRNPRIGDSLFTRIINHSVQYTSIPIAAKYYFSTRRLSVNLLAGISANIFSEGKISTEVNRGTEREHEKTHEIHGIKPVYFSGLGGLGLTYNIYKNVAITFSPTVNFALDPINRNVPVNSYPGIINFQVGLKTHL